MLVSKLGELFFLILEGTKDHTEKIYPLSEVTACQLLLYMSRDNTMHA